MSQKIENLDKPIGISLTKEQTAKVALLMGSDGERNKSAWFRKVLEFYFKNKGRVS